MAFNQTAVDEFTPAHFGVGAAMGSLGIPRSFAYLIIFGTEILEVFLRRFFPEFFEESRQNITVDLLASAAGYEVLRALLSK